MTCAGGCGCGGSCGCTDSPSPRFGDGDARMRDLLKGAHPPAAPVEYRPRFLWIPEPSEAVLLFPDPVGAIPAGPNGAIIAYENIRQQKMSLTPGTGNDDPLAGFRSGPRRQQPRVPVFGAPKSSCGFGATSTRSKIRMQPAMLDFGGYLNDYLLFWARAALDYYLETGDLSYYTAADNLGRHVLAQILQWAGHIAHEMGHVYCGSDHCCRSGLFQEHARGRLMCGVRAKMGLYVDSVDLSPSDDACSISDNLASYDDDLTPAEFAAAPDCCDTATATPNADGTYTCYSHSQQLYRINEGKPFIHGAWDADFFFCREPCAGVVVNPWDVADCDLVVDIGSRVKLYEAFGANGLVRQLQTWHSCGVP